MELTEEERRRLDAIIDPYLEDVRVREMGGYIQHGSVTTLDHVKSVAELAFLINARLRIGADERVLATGAILHDFYGYDWHGAGWRHSYRHAELARKNAERRFHIDEATQAVIRSHMWPISPLRPPSSREAIIVTVADKIVSARETLFRREGA